MSCPFMSYKSPFNHAVIHRADEKRNGAKEHHCLCVKNQTYSKSSNCQVLAPLDVGSASCRPLDCFGHLGFDIVSGLAITSSWLLQTASSRDQNGPVCCSISPSG